MPGISGHADKNGLLAWLGSFSKIPGFVFVNHGEDTQSIAFTSCLKQRGYDADSPYSGSEYDLLAGAYTYKAQGVRAKPKAPDKDSKFASNSNYWRTYQSAKELLDAVARLDGAPNKELTRLKRELDALILKYKR
jgi:metallo-beta-lactamase family protein